MRETKWIYNVLMVVLPVVTWAIFVLLLNIDNLADPPDPTLVGTDAYGHNREGALSTVTAWSAVELFILLLFARPWSRTRYWVVSAVGFFIFVPGLCWFGLLSMHGGGVFALHVMWLMAVNGLLLLLVICELSAEYARRRRLSSDPAA